MTQLVAEIGCNHQGSLATAQHMVRIFSRYVMTRFDPTDRAAAPILKFQKRTVQPDDRPYTGPHSFGATYGEHRAALELSIEDHANLKALCHAMGVGYACSVWDEQAAQEIMGLYPEYLKIPSACNLDFGLIGRCCSAWEGPIHISLGMTTAEEVEQIVSYVERMGASKRTWLYVCTSAYPCPADRVYLAHLGGMALQYRHRVAGFGYSGHHNGIAIDMAALSFDIDYLERHITLDRTWKGTDHAASLEPDGFRKLLRDAECVRHALNTRPVGILDVEQPAFEKLKRKRTDRVIPQKIKDHERDAIPT